MLNSEGSLMHYQVRHSNYLVLSFSHGKVDQKKTVAISQMFNHVQLCVHLYNTYRNLPRPRQECNKLLNLESGLNCVQVRCIANKIKTQNTPFFICSACLCLKLLEKIVAETLCFMHQGVFRPNNILITMLIF